MKHIYILDIDRDNLKVGQELAIGRFLLDLKLGGVYYPEVVYGKVEAIGPISFRLSSGHRVSFNGKVWGQPRWDVFDPAECRQYHQDYLSLTSQP